METACCDKMVYRVIKVLERIVDQRLMEIVKMDELQYAFMQGRGTVDVIVILKR